MFEQLLKDAGIKYLSELEATMRVNQQVVTGRTLASFKAKSDSDSMEITAPRYVGVLQEGRRGGTMPPVTAIQEWLKAKGITGTEKELKSRAFAVATSIKNRGTRLFNGTDSRFTKPTNTFTEPIEPTLQLFSKEITDLLRTSVTGAIKEGFK